MVTSSLMSWGCASVQVRKVGNLRHVRRPLADALLRAQEAFRQGGMETGPHLLEGETEMFGGEN